jgi:hypothetical protein
MTADTDPILSNLMTNDTLIEIIYGPRGHEPFLKDQWIMEMRVIIAQILWCVLICVPELLIVSCTHIFLIFLWALIFEFHTKNNIILSNCIISRKKNGS